MLNTKYKKIEESTCNNIALQDCNNREASKSKNKTLPRSTTSRI